MSFETMFTPEASEPELVNQGVHFIAQRISQVDPTAEVTISDFVTYPPHPFDSEDRLSKKITIHSGMHKIVLLAYESIDHSRRRAKLGEEQPYRNIAAEVVEFSGPTIPGNAYYMNCINGRQLTMDDTQGVGLIFIACSYDYEQKSMIAASGLSRITWRLEGEFVPFLETLLSYAQTQGCTRPVHDPQPVRTPAKISRKAFG